MTRAVTRLWYRIAVAKPDGTRVIIAAQGEHLGAAIAAAEKYAGAKARAVAAAVAPDGEIPLGDSVGKSGILDLGADPSPPSAAFAWPVGILPQLGSEAPLVDARAGYIERPDPKLFVLEAQVAADELVDAFLGIVERVPAADNLEIKILDHFEDAGTTDIWLTSRVNAKAVLRFLDDHDDELLHNGHVEVAIYLRKQRATLRLTEHKTIVWVADTREMEADVKKWLAALKVPNQDPRARVSSVPHFHYRGESTKPRAKLADLLHRQRLRRVDTLRRDTAG